MNGVKVERPYQTCHILRRILRISRWGVHQSGSQVILPLFLIWKSKYVYIRSPFFHLLQLTSYFTFQSSVQISGFVSASVYHARPYSSPIFKGKAVRTQPVKSYNREHPPHLSSCFFLSFFVTSQNLVGLVSGWLYESWRWRRSSSGSSESWLVYRPSEGASNKSM